MKKKALIKILGKQLCDGKLDKIELATQGTFEKKGDGYKISYEESELTGMDGVTTVIEAQGGQVIMSRTGEYTSQMIFEQGIRHLCLYSTPAGRINMAVSTKRVHNTLTPLGGSVKLSYELEVDNRRISANDFYITVKENVNANAL